MKRLLVACGVVMLAVLAGWFIHDSAQPIPQAPYPAPSDGAATHFPAPRAGGRVLTIEAATDISFMRPFIVDFQRLRPDVTIRYVDYLSSELLARAASACRANTPTPDIYLTVSTDHLVQLANDGCGRAAPQRAIEVSPGWAKWRDEVIAFATEPAVIVFDARRLKAAEAPRTHIALVDALRENAEAWTGRVGTYDIEQSGSGYNYATFDARQSATYGRLIESFGRIRAKIYCCSNIMVDAVDRGEILLAYNVQLSYAAAAQAAGRQVGIVLPADYQAVQTRSVMISRQARDLEDAQAFVTYLTSRRGQDVARALLRSPDQALVIGEIANADHLSQVSVDPSLLALRDQARRRQFIGEWLQAVRPSEGAKGSE